MSFIATQWIFSCPAGATFSERRLGKSLEARKKLSILFTEEPQSTQRIFVLCLPLRGPALGRDASNGKHKEQSTSNARI
jgi:hypothetical protein